DAASHYLHAGILLLCGVIAQVIAFGFCQDAEERRIAVRYPMAEGKAADEDGDTSEDGIKQIESSHRADADEVEQRPFHAQVGERLMQALEDSICAAFLLCFVGHIVLVSAWHATGSRAERQTAPTLPRANSGRSPREQLCPFRRQLRRAPFLRRVRRARNRSRRSRSLPDLQPSQWCR